MDTKDDHRLVHKDVNFMRFGGPLFVVVSPVFFLAQDRLPMFRLAGWVFVIFGVLATLFSSTLIVTADKSTRILRLRHQYLLFRQTRDIPFDDIADIQAQQSTGETGNDSSATVHRLVAILKDGSIVPFRKYFTRDDTKRKTAVDLRQFITGSRRSNTAKLEPPSTTLSM